MVAAGELFLLAASRLGSMGRRDRAHPDVDALLETLDYVDGNDTATDRHPSMRNRVAILRAAAVVSGLFAAENPDAPRARVFCGTADPGLLGKDFAPFPPVSVAGCDLEPGRAFERCIGEAVEYLSQIDWPGDSRIVLDDNLRDAEDFVSPSDGPRVRAVDLDSGAEVGLPARLCLRLPGLTQAPVGAGCAAGRTWPEAVCNGLWELIERDAVAAWWHGGEAPRPLPPDAAGAAVAYVDELRDGADGRWTVFLDISRHAGLPAVASYSFRRGGDGFVAGFAAHPDAAEAARKAAREMLQMELGLRFVMAKRALGRPPLNEDEVRQFRRAQAVKPTHWSLRPCGEARSHETATEGMSGDEMLRFTLERLRRVRLRSYAVDLSRARFGIPVAKVVAPGLLAVPDEAGWASTDPSRRIPLF